MRKGNGLALREFRQIKSLLKERLQKGGSIQKIYDDFLESELITMSRSSFYNYVHRILPEYDDADASSSLQTEDASKPQPAATRQPSGLRGLFD